MGVRDGSALLPVSHPPSSCGRSLTSACCDRYEREINLAQRSSIKRIQEQDSSASSPLVLCVTAIRWAEPPEAREMNPDEEPLMVISGLELTDGWYRIRANIDITLKNAAERGRIAVGCKLAISGARVRLSSSSVCGVGC